jgi:Derlin-1
MPLLSPLPPAQYTPVFTVPYWTLPFGLMAADVLQQQSGSAALPHIMGILTGHFYHFHTNIWPKLGGSEWLKPPDWVKGRLDEDGILKGEGGGKSIKRKRGKGVKLGSV